MDIKNLSNSLNAGRSNEVNKPQDKVANQTTDSVSNQDSNDDRVTLTDVLAQVRDLEVKSQGVKVDNSAKIAEIKAAIAEGSYQVDAKSIAEKLVQTEVLFSKS